MRICIHIIKDGEPRIIEEDIEIALQNVRKGRFIEWDINEHEGGSFTADTNYDVSKIAGIAEGVKRIIEEDTGGEVEVEIIEGWPPP